MSNLSRGKHAKAISDRSGQEFPYNEMVTEWNGSFVHVSEFEAKQPQLNPTRFTGDAQGLPNARPDRTVVFRNVDGSPGGILFSVFENASGFSISNVTTNTYDFDCGTNATTTEKAGGMTVTAGPVTLTP